MPRDLDGRLALGQQNPIRLALAAVVVVLGVLVVFGVAQGGPPKSDPAPTGAALAASKTRIAKGGKDVREGMMEFESEGCDRCHSIAATGADGKIGPRLDTLADDSVSTDVTNIVKPRADIVKGYPADLMPTDYAKRIKPDEIQAIAKFLKAASGSEKKKRGGSDDG